MNLTDGFLKFDFKSYLVQAVLIVRNLGILKVFPKKTDILLIFGLNLKLNKPSKELAVDDNVTYSKL